MIPLDKLFNKHSIIGMVGNRSTGKSMTMLGALIEYRKKYPDIPIYVYGVEEAVIPILEDKYNIITLESKRDITDLALTECVIWVDEFAMIFDTKSSSKQLSKLEAFFDRLEHRKIKFIFGTAREKFFNTFACSRMTLAIVKEIEYDALVNNTWLKDNIKAINSMSEYRLECPIDRCFVVSKKGGLVTKHKSSYYKELDTKQFKKSVFDTPIKESKPKRKFIKEVEKMTKISL